MRFPVVPAASLIAEVVPVALDYQIIDPLSGAASVPGDAIYEPYRCQSLRIAGAHPHPTPLVQSVADAGAGVA
eukprot:gene4072-5564_t